MKKFLAFALTLMMVLSLAACGEKTPTPSGSGTTGGTSQNGENNNDGKKESFVGKYDFAKDYMMPDAGNYQGYTEEKYIDGTLKGFFFDVSDITEQELNDYTAKLEANGYEFKGDEDDDFIKTGKTYRNDVEGVNILIAYIEADKDYRICVDKF